MLKTKANYILLLAAVPESVETDMKNLFTPVCFQRRPAMDQCHGEE